MAIWVHDENVSILSNREEVLDEMREQLGDALDKIGQDAASTAADKAPVDTGTLKNSISHVVDGTTVIIGTNVEYAPYQELGTDRGIIGKHFIQFGVTAHSSEYADIIKSMLED